MAREADKGMSGFSFKVFALAFVTTFDEARPRAPGPRRGALLTQHKGMHVCMHAVSSLALQMDVHSCYRSTSTRSAGVTLGWQVLLPEVNSQFQTPCSPRSPAMTHPRPCCSARPGHPLVMHVRTLRRIPPPCYRLVQGRVCTLALTYPCHRAGSRLQVLLLDADNQPLRNPEPLFDAAPFRSTGGMFWPDWCRPGAELGAPARPAARS
jgi:hypothetical protein